LLLGSPKSGKTTAVYQLVRECQRLGIGVLLPDVRGDYRELARQVPGALYVPVNELRINLFEPPEGVSLRRWLQVAAGRVTFDLGLRDASAAWAINLLSELADRCEGHS